MAKGLLILACVFAMIPDASLAQAPAGSTNCPPKASEPTGSNVQSSEKSAILPDAGGKDSAAPTVQQDGKDMTAQSECPPNRIEAPKPQQRQ